MWPFSKPEPKPIENAITRNAAKFAELGQRIEEGRKKLDAEFAARERAANHKQWCHSICRQAREVQRLNNASIYWFRSSQMSWARKSEFGALFLRRACSMQTEAQRASKKLLRTIGRYGVGQVDTTTNLSLRKQFERKVKLEQGKHAKTRCEGE